EYDARMMTVSKGTAAYFEQTTKLAMDMTRVLILRKGMEPVRAGVAKLAANWVMGPLTAALNEVELDIEQTPIPAAQLAKLLARLLDDTLTNRTAKDVFSAIWKGENGGDVDATIAARGLKQISDSGELEKICDQVIAANAKQVEDYRAGKDRAFNS